MFHSESFYVDFVTQILITVLGTNKGRSEKKKRISKNRIVPDMFRVHFLNFIVI